MSVTLFISYENCRISAKEVVEAHVHVTDVQITSVSNYRYPFVKKFKKFFLLKFKLNSCRIMHPQDHALIA